MTEVKKQSTLLCDIGKSVAGVSASNIASGVVVVADGEIPPSEKLNIAGVGGGGQAWSDLHNLGPYCNIVAICDVDDKRAEPSWKEFPNARRYRDFRKMLDKEDKNIDGVVVATPDNTHAVIAMRAIRMGKHVYCEKPMAHNIYEVRRLTEEAKKAGVVTQLGTQIHAEEGLKQAVEILASGKIGAVKKIDLWSSNFCNFVPLAAGKYEVPSTLDWDLWVGPANFRSYNPSYIPYLWRQWWDFGSGILGDMGCHIFDIPFWAFGLEAPESVFASSTEVDKDVVCRASIIHYKFAATAKHDAMEITWYDGGIYPPLPDGMNPDRKLPGSGGLYYGDKGTMLSIHCGGARLVPETDMKGFKKPEPFLPRGMNHYEDWVDACKTGRKASSDFDYSGPLTEAILLGNIAVRTGKKILWDSKNMKITNCEEANGYLRRQYRQGWSL